VDGDARPAMPAERELAVFGHANRRRKRAAAVFGSREPHGVAGAEGERDEVAGGGQLRLAELDALGRRADLDSEQQEQRQHVSSILEWTHG
jgi:hypothetical protein